MSAVPAASAAGSAAAAASPAAGTPPQLEDLPLRFLARHRQHAASGLRQATSPSASIDGGGGAATEDGWRIAYRHWRQPVPREQAPQATEGQVAGSSHGPGSRVASAAGTAVQPRPHTCVLFCNGLKSEMAGSKVRCALQQAAAQGCEFVCFDYSGFGASTGRAWESCGLTDWIEDTEALLREVVAAPRVVLLGSSIGGWVALRVAQRSATRAQGTLATAATCQGRGSSSSTSSTSSSSGSSSSSRGPQITGALLVAPAVDLSEVRWAALTQQQRDSVTAAAASSKAAAGSEGARGSGDGDGGAGGRVSLGSPYPMQQGGDWVGPAYFTQGREHLLLVRPWGEAGRREGQLGPSGRGPEQLGGPGTAAGR